MFETPTDSLDELDEYEFKALIDALCSDTWEDYVESYEEEPPAWVIEWAKHLETENIYSVTDLDPIWTYLNLIGDRSQNRYWLYTEGSDDCTCIMEQIPSSGGKPTNEDLWPLLKKDLEGIGNSILFGTFEINNTWIEKKHIGSYLQRLTKAESMTHLKGGTGPTVEEWLAEQYSK